MSESAVEPQPSVPDERVALGQLFKREREKRGMSVLDMANELKVLSSAVKGIEDADYASIRAEIFVRGYIKSYATFLGMDVKRCLAMYGEPPKDTSYRPMAKSSAPPKISESDSLDTLMKIVVPLVIIAVVPTVPCKMLIVPTVLCKMLIVPTVLCKMLIVPTVLCKMLIVPTVPCNMLIVPAVLCKMLIVPTVLCKMLIVPTVLCKMLIVPTVLCKMLIVPTVLCKMLIVPTVLFPIFLSCDIRGGAIAPLPSLSCCWLFVAC